ncbi:MAG: hypothetical protein PWP67_3060 [Clostridium butyricum]|nr:hypothetical protein [Clostridium butyricum]
MKSGKIILKIPQHSIDELLIYMLILVTSWQFFMPSTWLDEFVIIVLVAYTIVQKKAINKNFLILVCTYVVYCSIGLLVNRRISFYSIFILVDNFKPILLLVFILELKISKEKLVSVLNFFEIVNIPSLIIGIINAVRYNYLHQDLIISTGTFKDINGVIIERAGGMLGHSGSFSEVCAVLVIITLFHPKQKFFRWIKIIFYFIALYFGRGRFPLAIVIIAFCYFAFLNISKSLRKYLIYLFIFIGVLLSFPTMQYVMETFSTDFENQVRFVALRAIFSLITNVLLFGVGIGCLGNEKSILYNIDLYRALDLIKYGMLDWESQFAKNLLQTGIVGTVIWYVPFISCLHKVIKSTGEYKIVTMYMLIFYITNTILNKGYSMPFLVVMCILVAIQLNHQLVAE